MTRSRVALWVGATVTAADLAVAVAGLVVTRHVVGFDPLEDFVVPNVPVGLACAVCGLVIALQRPDLPVGWLFVVGGLGNLTAGAAVPWIHRGVASGWPDGLARGLVCVYSTAWPVGSICAYPLALLLFPDGRLRSRRWRVVVVAQVVVAVLTIGGQLLQPRVDGVPVGVSALTAVSWSARLDDVRTAVSVVQVLCTVAVLVSLVLRYRSGPDRMRRQLLWLSLAGAAALLSLSVFTTGAVSPLVLMTFALIPVSVVVAVLRYDLLDIRLVVSRALLYAALTALIVGVYVGLVALTDHVVGRRTAAGPIAAALIVAVALDPARRWLRLRLERMVYGRRSDPVHAITTVGRLLSEPDTGDTTEVLHEVRALLRLPYAEIRSDGTRSRSGVEVARVVTFPLLHKDVVLGDLVIGLRPGEHQLSPRDLEVLDLLGGPIAAALHAIRLSRDLQRSRERLVVAREQERQRIQRDLHDGLGPALAGIGMALDAAGNLLGHDPSSAQHVVARARRDVGDAIADVRRLIDGLRPPSLDQIGLVGALREFAARTHPVDGPLQVSISADPEHVDLPAAIEVAAYRIVVEALTNVARHASASSVRIRIDVHDDVAVEVADNGTGSSPWRPSIGLTSMAERTEEVGGRMTAGPTPHGGCVRVTLPLAATTLVDAPARSPGAVATAEPA